MSRRALTWGKILFDNPIRFGMAKGRNVDEDVGDREIVDENNAELQQHREEKRSMENTENK